MNWVTYDTGKMLRCARNMEKSMDEFKKKHKKINKIVNEEVPQHTRDPLVQAYQKKYAVLESDVSKLEKEIASYISMMRSAADKVANTVKKLDI